MQVIGAKRRVVVHQPENEAHEGYQPDNTVVTSQYTMLNFIPRNLFKQFQRSANVYFLLVVVLQCIPEISITKGIPTTAVPLLFVLAMSAGKDALEELARHRADRVENGRPVRRVAAWVADNAPPLTSGSDAGLGRARWAELRVGDIVKLQNRESVPADLLLLATSDARAGSAAVMTANLDGETNLKPRVVPKPLLGFLRGHAPPERQDDSEQQGQQGQQPVGGGGVKKVSGAEQAACLTGVLDCEAPNRHIGRFEGTFTTAANEKVPIGPDNLLLRGTQLRSTEWVLGLVVYTGHESKIMQNMSPAAHKVSRLARETDRQTVIAFGTDFLLCALAAIVGSSLVGAADVAGAHYIWGPGGGAPAAAAAGVLQFFTYVIIFTNYIPISLLVTQDLVKLAQAYMINGDFALYHAPSDTPTRVRCSDLNEELGQVEHVFSDKTGTLTCNLMVFARCSVAGRSFGDDGGSTDSFGDDCGAFEKLMLPARRLGQSGGGGGGGSGGGDASAGRAREFMLNLCLNHTVIPEQVAAATGGGSGRSGSGAVPAKIVYSAASPDEAALVDFARAHGFAFVGRSPDDVTIRVAQDHPRSPAAAMLRYEVLHNLEFTSDRKRSSVVVRCPDRSVRVYTKGADSVMLPRLSQQQQQQQQQQQGGGGGGSSGGASILARTTEDCDRFARAGWRTLWCASRVVPAAEYASWAKTFRAAEVALAGRRAKIAAAAASIERGLELSGATAIDDRLQDGVPAAIAALREGGVKVWVLTGDKVDTAITIGKSASIITQSMAQLRLCAEDAPDSASAAPRDPDGLQLPAGGDGVPTLESTRACLGALRQRAAAEARGSGGAAQMALIVDSDALEAVFRHGGADVGASRAARRAAGAAAAAELEKQQQHGGLRKQGSWRKDDIMAAQAADPRIVADFIALCAAMRSIVCCRVTPAQKAQVVTLIKNTPEQPVTLAIGDGANDVAMIQAAHIGVGISGQEGLQAVNASDYAIAQFRFLRRLLFVHGRWSLRRLGALTCYMFYKNAALCFPQYIFGFFCLFSGQNFYNDWLYQMYNIVFTGLPVCVFGLLDQDVDAETSLRCPALYADGPGGAFFTPRKFWVWMLEALLHAAICFGFSFAAFSDTDSSSAEGEMHGMWDVGTSVFMSTVAVVTMRLCLEAKSWNAYFAWLVPLEVVALVVMVIWVGAAGSNGRPMWGTLAYTALLVWERLKLQPVFWATQLLVLVASFVVSFAPTAWCTLFQPRLRHVMREAMKKGVVVREAHLTELGKASAASTMQHSPSPRQGSQHDLRQLEMTAVAPAGGRGGAPSPARLTHGSPAQQLDFLHSRPEWSEANPMPRAPSFRQGAPPL